MNGRGSYTNSLAWLGHTGGARDDASNGGPTKCLEVRGGVAAGRLRACHRRSGSAGVQHRACAVVQGACGDMHGMPVGIPLPLQVLVLDCVCIDCSEHVISWAVASPAPVAAVDVVAPPSTPHYSLMAPHDDGQPACPDDLHSLFQLAEALFQVSPLCSPNHAPPSSPQEEDWEQQSWVRLLHCLLLPLLTLHREDLGSLRAALNHHSSHTLTTLDTNIAHNSTVAAEVHDPATRGLCTMCCVCPFMCSTNMSLRPSEQTCCQ